MTLTDTTTAERYSIRVDPLFRGLFSALGAGSRHDFVDVDGAGLNVRLGWLFRATIPRSAVVSGDHHADMFGGWGAHGWRGRWLVNGSSKGIVQVDVEPRQRAWLLGVWPIRLRSLYVSLADPNGFLEAVQPHVPEAATA
jgi:hypothetical protein